MVSMTPMMSPILRELALMRSMVSMTSCTVCPPDSATWLACSARVRAWVERCTLSHRPSTAERSVAAAMWRAVMSVAYLTTLKGRPLASKMGL